MPGTIDEQIAAIDAQLAALVEDGVKVIALGATAKLVETTPVATGWARANWLPSVATPLDAPSGDRKSVDTAAQAAGIAAIAAYKMSDGPAYVTNPVPYITRLNAGSSTQAPAMFVERAIDAVVAEAQANAVAGVEFTRDQNAELLALLGVG